MIHETSSSLISTVILPFYTTLRKSTPLQSVYNKRLVFERLKLNKNKSQRIEKIGQYLPSLDQAYKE